MNKKKILSLMLAGCMLTSMIPAALATELTQDTTPPAVIESVEGEVNSNTEPSPNEVVATTEPTTTPGGTETPDATAPNVAEIGGQGYASLAEAVTAATSGDTIKLIADSALEATVKFDKNLTLDLNGKKLETASFTLHVASGSLTVTGDGTINNAVNADFANKVPGTMFAVVKGATLTIENGTYTTKAVQLIHTMGTATVKSGTFTCAREDLKGEYDGKCIMVAEGTDATLTVLGGTLTATDGDDYSGMNGLYAKNGASIILGDEKNKTGPTIHTDYSVIGANNTTATSNFTIYSGHYIIDATGLGNGNANNRHNAVVYMSCNGTYNISGGTFEGRGTYSNVFSVPYTDTTITANISGGKFTAQQGVFYIGNEQGVNKGSVTGQNKLNVTGGTFSHDPADFVVAGSIGVKNADNKYEVMTMAKAFAPTMDVTQAGGVTATKTGAEFTLSGTVDPRTYTVTDANLQTLFVTLLTDKQPDTNTSRTVAPVSGKIMYIANNKNLSFATMHFDNLVAGQSYIIQQVNPALNYAYGDNAFPDNTKIQSYTCEQLADGLSFMISSQPGPITFKIAPVPAAAANAAAGEVIPMPEPAAVYTITNGVTFTASEKPGTTTVEPPVKVETVDGTVTAKADVAKEAVETAVSSAGTTGTVTIAATSPVENVNAAEVALPKEAVEALATSTEAKVENVEIQTSVGTVKLPGDALKKIAGDSGVSSNGATVNVSKTTQTVNSVSLSAFEVTVKGGSNAVTLTGLTAKPITLSFNVGANRTDSPVLMHVDNSVLKPIVSSSYDATTGILTAETSHLSTFAVFAATDVEKGGIGCKVTLTSTEANKYLTIQVTHGNANSIYTVQADSSSKAVIYVQSGTVLNVWQTDDAPIFDNGSFTPKGTPTILVDNKTVTAP